MHSFVHPAHSPLSQQHPKASVAPWHPRGNSVHYKARSILPRLNTNPRLFKTKMFKFPSQSKSPCSPPHFKAGTICSNSDQLVSLKLQLDMHKPLVLKQDHLHRAGHQFDSFPKPVEMKTIPQAPCRARKPHIQVTLPTQLQQLTMTATSSQHGDHTSPPHPRNPRLAINFIVCWSQPPATYPSPLLAVPLATACFNRF